MDAYTSFAFVYDLFMDNVPYEDWHEYLLSLLKEYDISDGILLDLGCGTGKMARLLREDGYDMIGVDNSMEMLEIARSKEQMQDESSKKEILYLLQDMQEFELYGTVRAVYSGCDSLNYILSEEELKTVFSLVNNYLDPCGIFIFDMNTSYKYEELLSDNTFAENREECSFIWENYYDEDERINEYDLTLFIQEPDAENEVFYRYQETHYQKNYELKTVCDLLEQAGLKLEAVYDAYTRKTLSDTSERVTIIARECQKQV